MGKVYFVSNEEYTTLNLWRLEKDKFRIIEFGKFNILLSGIDYVLIHKDYVEVFKEVLESKLEIIPVKIERLSTGEIFDDFYEMKIKQRFSYKRVNVSERKGDKVWGGYGSLLVSTNIKIKLEKKSKGELEITEYYEGSIG